MKRAVYEQKLDPSAYKVFGNRLKGYTQVDLMHAERLESNGRIRESACEETGPLGPQVCPSLPNESSGA
jgi:hypothetical protein